MRVELSRTASDEKLGARPGNKASQDICIPIMFRL